MTKDSTEGRPVLSNRLADLAERAGEAALAYRRGSIASIGAYLIAGELLSEARGESRRGQWGAVLDRAGIAPRTSRLMMQAARKVRETGADAATVHDAGGIQAFVAGRETDPDEAEKTALSAGNGDPEPDESPALVLESPVAAGETRSVQASAAVPAKSDPRSATAPGPMTLYQWRRARGDCTSCGSPADGAVRCVPCAERVSAQRAKRREFAAIGDVLAPRIEAAVKAGEGIQLDAAEVAALASPPLRKRKAAKR